MLRLPQDAYVGDRSRGVPADLSQLQASVSEYADLHARALGAGDFEARARACWGLVARAAESLTWCEAGLRSGIPDRAEDAAGVLAWIGCPPSLARRLRKELRALPDGAARDVLEALVAAPAADATGDGEQRYDGVPLKGDAEPFTSIIYFLEAPFDRIVSEHAAWRVEIASPFRERELHAPLSSLSRNLEPVVMPSTTYAFVETASAWTALFSQQSDLNWADRFAVRLGTRVVCTSYSPAVVRGGEVRRYADVSFRITDGAAKDTPLHCTRALQASQQGTRWDWDDLGTPLAFEETNAYRSRRVRDRFDLPRMNRYCVALGIRRSEAEFYGPRAALIELDTSRWPHPPGPGVPSSEWRAANA
jgi:hypothetical protein